jgi:hypothetical protein
MRRPGGLIETGSADAPSEFLAANSVSSPLRDPTASPEVGPARLADDFTATAEAEARRRRRLLHRGWLALAAMLPAFLVWIESRAGPLLQRLLPVRAVRPVCGGSEDPPPPVGTPLLGFIKDRPSASTDVVRPLPGGPKPALRLGAATLRARSALAVTTASTVFSARHPAGLVHPASGHGVRCVSAPLPVAPRPKAQDRSLGFPDSAPPFGAFPVAAGRGASPRLDALSPLFLGSSLVPPVLPRVEVQAFRRSLDLRVLLRCEVRCTCRRCHRRVARCSLGLCPRRVRDASVPRPRPESRGGLRPGGRRVVRLAARRSRGSPRNPEARRLARR